MTTAILPALKLRAFNPAPPSTAIHSCGRTATAATWTAWRTASPPSRRASGQPPTRAPTTMKDNGSRRSSPGSRAPAGRRSRRSSSASPCARAAGSRCGSGASAGCARASPRTPPERGRRAAAGGRGRRAPPETHRSQTEPPRLRGGPRSLLKPPPTTRCRCCQTHVLPAINGSANDAAPKKCQRRSTRTQTGVHSCCNSTRNDRDNRCTMVSHRQRSQRR